MGANSLHQWRAGGGGVAPSQRLLGAQTRQKGTKGNVVAPLTKGLLIYCVILPTYSVKIEGAGRKRKARYSFVTVKLRLESNFVSNITLPCM